MWSDIVFPFAYVINKQEHEHKERKLELQARAEEAKAEQMQFSNGDYSKMEERVRVLERIATDGNHALATQIEQLRALDAAEESGSALVSGWAIVAVVALVVCIVRLNKRVTKLNAASWSTSEATKASPIEAAAEAQREIEFARTYQGARAHRHRWQFARRAGNQENSRRNRSAAEQQPD